MSLYNGSVEFAWPHGTLRFRFTYQRLEALQAARPDDAYLEFITEAIDKRQIEALVELASIASGKTVAEINLMSPPILPMATALMQAWQAAWYGADDIPKSAPEKTTPRPGLESVKRFLPRFASGLAGASSGS